MLKLSSPTFPTQMQLQLSVQSSGNLEKCPGVWIYWIWMLKTKYQTKVKAKSALDTSFQLLYGQSRQYQHIFSEVAHVSLNPFGSLFNFFYLHNMGNCENVLGLTVSCEQGKYFPEADGLYGLDVHFPASRLHNICRYSPWLLPIFTILLAPYYLKSTFSYHPKYFVKSKIFDRRGPWPWPHFVFETCNHEMFPEKIEVCLFARGQR